MEELKLFTGLIEEIKDQLDDGQYKGILECSKKIYDHCNDHKYVRVLKIQSSVLVFWADLEGESGISHVEHHGWAHRSDREPDMEDQNHLSRVEMKQRSVETYHILKVIDHDQGEYPVINWEKNTIMMGAYEKLKITKFRHCCNEIVVFLNDL